MYKYKVAILYFLMFFSSVINMYFVFENNHIRKQTVILKENINVLKQHKDFLTELSIIQVMNQSEIPEGFYTTDEEGKQVDVVELLYSGENVIFCLDDKTCSLCVNNEIELLKKYFPNLNIYFCTNSNNYAEIKRYVKVLKNIKVLFAGVEFEEEFFKNHLPFYLFFDTDSNILKKFYAFKEVPDLTITFLQNIYGEKTS